VWLSWAHERHIWNLESASVYQRRVFWVPVLIYAFYGMLSRHRVDRRQFASVMSFVFPWFTHAVCGILSGRRDARRWFSSAVSFGFLMLMFTMYGILSRLRKIGVATLGVVLQASCLLASLPSRVLLNLESASRRRAPRCLASVCQRRVVWRLQDPLGFMCNSTSVSRCSALVR
jgi:hypothetical protein